LAVTVPEDVESSPRVDLQLPDAEHRRERRFDERLTGLAIAAGVRDTPRAGELIDRRTDARLGGREIDESRPGLDRCIGVEKTRTKFGDAGLIEARLEGGELVVLVALRRRRFGRCKVDDDETRHVLSATKVLEL